MPIRVVKGLPAIGKLSEENIFVMDSERAESQDIRPLHLVVVNLMPRKEATEIQLLRALSNTPLQTKVTFLYMTSYTASNTSQEYLETFYRTFEEIKDQYFDGLIITGAPVEQMPFEEVDYWDELSEIMEWSKTHVCSTLYICWGAQAGILDELFYMPHSRHTTVSEREINAHPQLEVLVRADKTGVGIVRSYDNKHVFVFGHPEYDRDTLYQEYDRDRKLGLDIEIPENYFPGDDPTKDPIIRWRSASTILYTNWLNYYVYQETPYEVSELQSRPIEETYILDWVI